MTVPEHVAIIMDGNGRWAEKRGKNRIFGHRAGAKTLENTLRVCCRRGVKYLTVYAFSTENWKRPEAEVNGLMTLLSVFVSAKEKLLMKERIRFRLVGRRCDLPSSLVGKIEALEKKTENFDTQLIVAVSYGGRAEIVDAAIRFAQCEHKDEASFASCLYAPDVPDPDLIIRTSGEQRLSNFLLWQAAYSEFYFTDVLWPDFSEKDLDDALCAYAARDRRKGGIGVDAQP